MNDKLTKGGPAPRQGTRGGPSGSHLVPEGATANFTGSKRGQYPKGSEPTPGQRVRPGPSGKSQTPDIPTGKPKPPIATRQGKGSGKPAGSVSNPFKSQGGSSASKL
jgi:hypothetical protein